MFRPPLGLFYPSKNPPAGARQLEVDDRLVGNGIELCLSVREPLAGNNRSGINRIQSAIRPSSDKHRLPAPQEIDAAWHVALKLGVLHQSGDLGNVFLDDQQLAG